MLRVVMENEIDLELGVLYCTVLISDSWQLAADPSIDA